MQARYRVRTRTRRRQSRNRLQDLGVKAGQGRNSGVMPMRYAGRAQLFRVSHPSIRPWFSLWRSRTLMASQPTSIAKLPKPKSFSGSRHHHRGRTGTRPRWQRQVICSSGGAAEPTATRGGSGRGWRGFLPTIKRSIYSTTCVHINAVEPRRSRNCWVNIRSFIVRLDANRRDINR